MTKFELGWSLLFALAFASTASADMGTPGLKRPKITHRLTTSEDVSTYAFLIVHYRSSYDSKTRSTINEDEGDFVEFGPDKPLLVTTPKRREIVELLMIRRENAHEKTGTAVLEDIKNNRIEVVFRSELTFREDVPEWSANDLTIEHRFQHASKGNGFELIRTSWGSDWQCCAVCLAIPMALVFIGIWVARRLPPPISEVRAE